MRGLWKRLVKVAKNPAVRPLEVWALRALLAWVAVRLGIDAKELAK